MLIPLIIFLKKVHIELLKQWRDRKRGRLGYEQVKHKSMNNEVVSRVYYTWLTQYRSLKSRESKVMAMN